MTFTVEALGSRFLDRAVHSLDLPVCRRMFRFGQPIVDIVPGAGDFEGMGAEELSSCDGLFDLGDSRGAAA